MKKKIWSRAARERVKAWFDYWIRMLSLDPVFVTWDFEGKDKDADDEGRILLMTIKSGFPYRNMNITVYPDAAELGNRRLGQVVCHELMHYVVKPMNRNRLESFGIYMDYEEEVVDKLAMCFENMAFHLDKNRKR